MEDDEQLARRDPGSFRDPTSAVYRSGDAIYRGIDAATEKELRPLLAKVFLKKAIERGDVAATEVADDPPVDLEVDAISAKWAACLRHDAVPVLSYPYE